MAKELDYSKRFRQICEMTFVGGNDIVEADEEGIVDDTKGSEGGEGGGMPDMDGDMSQMFGGEGQPEGGMPAGQGEEGAAQPPEGFNPQPQEAGMGMAPEGPDEGDDVVDITDLVDSQDDIEHKVGALDKKFTKAMKAIEEFSELISASNDKIGELRAEFERRNPTQVEKMNIQTSKSYPFTQSVDEFWKEKEANSNYSSEPDNNGKEQGQYVITNNDVNGNVDWRSISDSMNDDDDDWIYNQNLASMMRI